jgi:hypothetical protein
MSQARGESGCAAVDARSFLLSLDTRQHFPQAVNVAQTWAKQAKLSHPIASASAEAIGTD